MSQNLNVIINGIQYMPVSEIIEPEKPKSKVLFEIEKPEIGETYHYIDSFNRVTIGTWKDNQYNNFHFSINNVFLTLENAKKQADRKQLLAEIERFAVENNEKIDWSNLNNSKYFISYDNLDNRWVGDSNSKYKIQGVTYFSSATVTSGALKKFKDRLDILLD